MGVEWAGKSEWSWPTLAKRTKESMMRDKRLASPKELADMFGVTDPSEVSDDLYDDYLAWMEDPMSEWADTEETEPGAPSPGEAPCEPGAPTVGHLRSHEEEADEEELGDIDEPERTGCAVCCRAVYWRMDLGKWVHYDSDNDGHDAWVRA